MCDEVDDRFIGCPKDEIRIDADGDVLFQEAIDTLDICKLMGFTKVSLKIKQRDK